MARYFFHLYHCKLFILDEEGGNFRSFADAQLAAIVAAREMIGADACEGVLALDARIDIANSRGRIVGSICFRDTVDVFD